MSKAEPLYRLQLLDLDIDKARKQLREVEGALATSPTVLHAQSELDVARSSQHKAATEVRSLELDVGSLDEKIKGNEDRLYTGNIRTPKELVDLQRELEMLKRHHGELEETLLMAMLAMEETNEVEKRCHSARDEANRHWQEDSVALREERAQLIDRISANQERREAICVAIPRADLELYTALRARKPGGIAVAIIKVGACGLCGEEPSSVLLQETRTGSSLALCRGCGRILFAG